jgi:hypothetical protein
MMMTPSHGDLPWMLFGQSYTAEQPNCRIELSPLDGWQSASQATGESAITPKAGMMLHCGM